MADQRRLVSDRGASRSAEEHAKREQARSFTPFPLPVTVRPLVANRVLRLDCPFGSSYRLVERATGVNLRCISREERVFSLLFISSRPHLTAGDFLGESLMDSMQGSTAVYIVSPPES